MATRRTNYAFTPLAVTGPCRIIGVDVGTLCGIAVGHFLGPVKPGMAPISVDVTEFDLSFESDQEAVGARGHRLWRRLGALLDHGPPVAGLLYERVQFSNSIYSAHVIGGLSELVTLSCHVRDIPYTGVPTATVKRAATGHGDAHKDQIVVAMRERFPFLRIETDNMADALGVLCSFIDNVQPVSDRARKRNWARKKAALRRAQKGKGPGAPLF